MWSGTLGQTWIIWHAILILYWRWLGWNKCWNYLACRRRHKFLWRPCTQIPGLWVLLLPITQCHQSCAPRNYGWKFSFVPLLQVLAAITRIGPWTSLFRALYVWYFPSQTCQDTITVSRDSLRLSNWECHLGTQSMVGLNTSCKIQECVPMANISVHRELIKIHTRKANFTCCSLSCIHPKGVLSIFCTILMLMWISS